MPKGNTSPRVLSRGRQPPLPSHSTTSVSSTSSTRQDRSTRSHQNAKASSPQKSATPQSLTSEEAADEARGGGSSEQHNLRRSRRTHDIDEDGDAALVDAPGDDEEIVEDEETTRCICGYQEYPGPPVDLTLSSSSRGKGSHPPEDADAERGGLFIQCDDCQVWQHGGCVSLMEESAVPDNYYCEECKPELHELLKAPNGQKFSHYLPVWSKSHPKTARKGSIDPADKTKPSKETKERSSRASALPETKRRSTMNSRAAYDEDEVLRKVLEESKVEGQPSTEGGSRKGKRNRDESEDPRIGIKRQRTASSVLSSHSGDDSENEADDTITKKPLPRQAVAKPATVKTEKSAQAEPVVKRRGGRRGGGDGGEQNSHSSANGADANWTCHCGLWTCLCAPSLIRGDTETKNKPASSSIVEDEEDESVPPSARLSAKASPVAEDVPDTPTLNASTGVGGKKGGKKNAAGRGRSNPAPTPSEREEKDSPRNGGDPDATPVPTVSINGNTSKRGKRGQHKDHDSAESDKDPHASANGTAAQSDAEPTSNGNGGEGHHASTSLSHNTHNQHNSLHGHGKKKEPSMNELKRRAAAMLDWVEKAKEDLGRSSLVSLSMSPSSGSLTPPNGVGGGIGGLPMLGGPVRGELGVAAEGLHARLLGWQVEYGTG